MTGPDGLLKLFTKNVLETALNEEMTEHLGHEKNRAEPDRESRNVRNGARSKTVISDAAGESFNSRVRDECLNINIFWSLARARVVITDWKHDYNHRRRHSSLGYQAPADYAAVCTHR